MKSVRGKDQWVWVIVQDPGGKEQFLGQHDQQENISFIPAFHSKEEAQQCFMNMACQKDRKYEVQAILYEERISHLFYFGRKSRNGFRP